MVLPCRQGAPIVNHRICPIEPPAPLLRIYVGQRLVTALILSHTDFIHPGGHTA